MMPFRDLQAQYRALRDPLEAAVVEVMRTGCYVGGPYVEELEERLAAFVGVRHCVTCASGTDALVLSLRAWDIGPGDAVFLPDFTFFATAEAVLTVGATPVLVDVDERTFNIDPQAAKDAVEAVIAEGRLVPKALIAVDLFGLPADYGSLRALCGQYGLRLLEDSAQGFGGAIGETRDGAFGDMAITSFFPSKPLGCMGDGGALFTNNDTWASLVRSMASHGAGTSKYDNVRLGMNSRLDAIQAAVLLVKLEALASEQAKSEQVASRYSEALRATSAELPFVPDGFTSAWAQYTVRLPEKLDRKALCRGLAAANVPVRLYYARPLHEQAALRHADCWHGATPVADRLARTVLSLPMGPYLTEEDQRQVVAAFAGILERGA